MTQNGIETTEGKMGRIINVSNSNGTYSFLPQIVMSEPTNTLYVIWQESRGFFDNFAQRDHSNQSLSIVYRTSDDNGTTFSDTATLYNYTSPNSFGFPEVSYSENGSKIYLTWVDNSTNDNIDVYFSRAEYGSGFEKPVKIGSSTITNNNTGIETSYPGQIARSHRIVSPQVVTSGNQNVYVMWTETLAVLTKAPKIPQAPTNQSVGNYSEVIIDGTNGKTNEIPSYRDLLPQYDTDKSVFLIAGDDSGSSFGKPLTILNETDKSSSASFIDQPAILTASANNVYIVTTRNSGENLEDHHLSLFVSRDNGSSFEEKQIMPALDNSTDKVPVYAYPVVPNNNSSSLYMLVTMAENKTKSIVEKEGGKINSDLPPFLDLTYSQFFIRSDDAGSTFSRPVQMANNTSSASGSQLAVSKDGNSVYVAWLDPGLDVLDLLRAGSQSGRYVSPDELEKLNPAGSVLVRASSDKGNAFGEITRLNDSKPIGSGLSFGGDAGMLLPHGDDGLYVIKSRTIYHEPTERVLPSSEILIWASTDGGSSFQGPTKISDNIAGSQFGSFGGSKATSLTPQALYVVWSGGDYYAGNQDVFFRKLGQ